RRRLDAEAMRDAMLSASGQLSLIDGGPSVYPELPAEMKASTKGWKPSATEAERNRRSVYVAVRRNLRYPLLAAFDAPDASEPCGRRFTTTTAPQALMLLNDGIVLAQATRFSQRVQREAGTEPDAVIDRAFKLALGREPVSEERDAMRRFLLARPDRAAAVADLCHAVLN